MRSRERVNKLGEVFTPRSVALDMLRHIPEHEWADSEHNVLDPACGNGAFLTCVVHLKVKAGLTPLKALLTTHGVDIMQDNVNECRELMLQYAEKASQQVRSQEWIEAVINNVVCADALTFDWKEFRRKIDG